MVSVSMGDWCCEQLAIWFSAQDMLKHVVATVINEGVDYIIRYRILHLGHSMSNHQEIVGSPLGF